MSTRNRHLSFPFRIGKHGMPVQVSTLEEHIRDELIQLLLTDPGERLFLPEFGGGIRRLVFSEGDNQRIAVAKSHLSRAISNWLGSRIAIEKLEMKVKGEKIEIELIYRIIATNEPQRIRFQRLG